MADLSVLIPARNEMFLARTIEDVLAHLRGDTEIIALLDGQWADPPIKDHPRVTLVYYGTSIGQRAATNQAARLSRAKYVMKLDAHCALDEGFDLKLMAPYESGELSMDVTSIPAQKNLHVFDWVCECGKRQYQGPTPTKCACEQPRYRREIVWRPRRGTTTTAWRFDNTLHFQYWGEFERRPEAQQEIHDVLSCLGACWFLPRERYWALGGMDEEHGSWGQMGTELACKSWLSGGRMVVNRRTWFAHCFRTQGGDFGFPYPLSGREVSRARRHSRRLWVEGGWPQAVRPLSWLIDRFAPVPGWEGQQNVVGVPSPRGDPDLVSSASHPPDTPPSVSPAAPDVAIPLTKGLLYYTDNRLDPTLAQAVQAQIDRCRNGWPLVAVGLQPIDPPFGGVALALGLERGPLAMFKQILAGLEVLDTDLVFFCEHDVLYHPSHFTFIPEKLDRFYYNENRWQVDTQTGRALHFRCCQTSGLCGPRKLLVAHYRKRVAMVEALGRYERRMGYEPGAPPGRVDDTPSETWRSPFPNIDLRHPGNLTRTRWSRDQFRDKRTCRGWLEADEIPGWGTPKGRFTAFLEGLNRAGGQ